MIQAACPLIAWQPRSGARMKVRAVIYALFLLAVVVLLAMPAWARSHKQPAKQADPSDPGYVSALATANRFLHAWQAGDLENGMVLLSDGIRHSQNADKLEEFFSTTTERAFEIRTGHGKPGRYSFPVVLLAPRGDHVARRSSQITVVNTGKNDWVVDELP
jgi:hypothetical protein